MIVLVKFYSSLEINNQLLMVSTHGVAFPLQTSVAAFSLFSEMQEADIFTDNFFLKMS